MVWDMTIERARKRRRGRRRRRRGGYLVFGVNGFFRFGARDHGWVIDSSFAGQMFGWLDGLC